MRPYRSSDEGLTALANQLEFLQFELGEADVAHFESLREAERLINVSRCLHGRTFRVRLCIGGKQHVIGLTRNGPNAARFADLAKLFFWPYRMREKRLPEDADFNFGLVDTENAMDNHPEAVRLLGRIRDHLVSVSKLRLTTSSNEDERNDRDGARQARRTARGELLRIEQAAEKRALALEAALISLQKAVESNTLLFDQCKQAFHHILEKLAKLESKSADN